MSKKPPADDKPAKPKKCPRCNDTGMVSVAGSGNLHEFIPCKVCNGTGQA